MFYKINLSFRRFGCGTGQLTGSNGYYIGLPFRKTRRASSVLRAHGLVNSSSGTRTCDHRPLYHHQGPWCDHLFHDRLTCARSRCRCSRPERGQPEVPFSACRCHILVVDYQWGSMGSDETAITIPGALEKLTFFTGTGRHRVQIIYFFGCRSARSRPLG